MDTYLKAIAAVFITVVFYLVLEKQNKDIALLLTLAACCVLFLVAASFLKPVMAFFQRLQTLGGLDSDMLLIILKSVGLGLLSEITMLICTDVGNAALGKAVQIGATAVILWLSLPLFTSLIELVTQILGTI